MLDITFDSRAIVHQLVQLRKSAGLSQREVAKRCGMSQSQLSVIEKGGYELKISTLRRIAWALGWDLRLVATRLEETP